MNPVGIIRVQFHATMTISFPGNSPAITVLIQIVRGTQTSDVSVYSAILSIPGLGETGPLIFPFTVTGSDYNVPAPANNQLVYTAFISATSSIPISTQPLIQTLKAKRQRPRREVGVFASCIAHRIEL